MPDPFITVQSLSDLLGRSLASDPGGTIAVRAACDICRTVAERPFTRGTTTAAYDGNDTDALVLPVLPVLNAGTVTVAGGTVTDYMLTANGVLLRGTAGADPRPVWPLGRQNVRVTYEHGYDTLNFPEDVRQVALNVATRLVVAGPASEEQVGDVRVRYAASASDLTKTETLILHKYRPRF